MNDLTASLVLESSVEYLPLEFRREFLGVVLGSCRPCGYGVQTIHLCFLHPLADGAGRDSISSGGCAYSVSLSKGGCISSYLGSLRVSGVWHVTWN